MRVVQCNARYGSVLAGVVREHAIADICCRNSVCLCLSVCLSVSHAGNRRLNGSVYFEICCVSHDRTMFLVFLRLSLAVQTSGVQANEGVQQRYPCQITIWPICHDNSQTMRLYVCMF